MSADPLDQSQVPALTVQEWMHVRQAFDLPVLVAVRRMLEDIEAGLVAAEERARHGLPLH